MSCLANRRVSYEKLHSNRCNSEFLDVICRNPACNDRKPKLKIGKDGTLVFTRAVVFNSVVKMLVRLFREIGDVIILTLLRFL